MIKVKDDHVEGHLHFYFGTVESKMLFLNFMDLDLRVRNSISGRNWSNSAFSPKTDPLFI